MVTRRPPDSRVPRTRSSRTAPRSPRTRRPSGVSAKPQGRPEMPASRDLTETILAAWRTNNLVTVFLVRGIPTAVWAAPVPGAPRKTIRMLAGHLHNARCMWLKTLGRPHGIPVPSAVDRRKVSRRQLAAALKRSSRGIEALLRLGCRSGGRGSRQPGLRVAESAVGRRSRPDLLRSPRGPSPRTDRVGGEADRLPLAGCGDRWPVAVDETCRRVAGPAPRGRLARACGRIARRPRLVHGSLRSPSPFARRAHEQRHRIRTGSTS